jgi:hypothetical protein
MQKGVVIIIAGVGVLGLLIAGAMLNNSGSKAGGASAGSAASAAPADNGAAPVAPSATPAVATPAVPAPAEKPQTLASKIEDFESAVWRPMNGGLETEILKKDEIRVHGTSQFADWNHQSGIVTNTNIPDGDFTLNVDIKIPVFTGDTGYKNPYMRVVARNQSAIGVYANPAFGYQMHDWKPTQTHSSSHRLFGNEATTYHRLTLKWEDAAGKATALVDGELIGTIDTQLGTGRKISLYVITPVKGPEVDVLFRNLKVEIPASLEDTP